MTDAVNNEYKTAGEAAAQQGTIVSSSEHERRKPVDPLEVSHPNDLTMRPPERFSTKGKSTNGTTKQVY